MEIAANAVDQQIDIVAVSTSGHLTGLAASDLTLWYHRPGAAQVAIALADKSAVDDDHADGEIFEIGNGAYQLDLPDAALVAGVAQVVIGGTAAGGSVIVQPIDLIGQHTTAATPTSVWSYTTRTLTSLSALVASIAAAVWAYATRTLSVSAEQTALGYVAGTWYITRGDTIDDVLTVDSLAADDAKLWVTAKREASHRDAQALFVIDSDDGLTVINGVDAGDDAAEGSIAIEDATAKTVRVQLTAEQCAKLPAGRWSYDVQRLTAAGAIVTAGTGSVIIAADITRAVT